MTLYVLEADKPTQHAMKVRRGAKRGMVELDGDKSWGWQPMGQIVMEKLDRSKS
jgi:hypothetical protein